MPIRIVFISLLNLADNFFLEQVVLNCSSALVCLTSLALGLFLDLVFDVDAVFFLLFKGTALAI